MPSLQATVDQIGQNPVYVTFRTVEQRLNADGQLRGYIDATGQNIAYFKRLIAQDDIGKFYPYCQVWLPDQGGEVVDTYSFIEGDTFELEIGRNDNEVSLFNKYAWSEFQMNDTYKSDKIAGINHYILKDNNYFLDVPKTRAFKSMTTSAIVEQVILDDFNLLPTKVFITETTDPHDEYQLNETNLQFLTRLAGRAFTTSFPGDPFYTFFNTRGEFFFMCLNDLFNPSLNLIPLSDGTKINEGDPRIKTCGKYRMEFSETQTLEKFIIQGYTVNFPGLTLNKPNYYRKTYYTDPEGNSVEGESKITNHTGLIGKNLSKTLIKKDYLEDVQSFNYLGIANNLAIEKPFFDGVRNNLFKSSCLSYRMRVSIHFNPYAVAGRLITLDINSPNPMKGKSTEYSGDWLILQSKFRDDEGLAPMQYLTIGKPNLEVDAVNPFIRDFLPYTPPI